MGQLVQKTSEIKLPKSKALLKAKNLKKTQDCCMNASELFGS